MYVKEDKKTIIMFDFNIPKKVLLDSKQHDCTHVFLIVNNMTAIIARMIIDTFKINKENILIISFRNTNLDFLRYKSLKILSRKIDRYYEKLFFQSPAGSKILKEIDKNNFIVYSSWASRELNWLMSAKQCIGHYYIEEGQGSYMNHYPYSIANLSLKQKIINNWKNRVNEDDKSGYFYRDDAIGYIGISKETFPKVLREKKITLQDIKSLKKYYSPKLLGIKYIGLTCAERRIKDNNWKKMLKILVSKLPKNSVVKAHPSLIFNQERFNTLKQNLIDVSDGEIDLCTNDIIIELEMLFEKKQLIGPQTSLNRYSKILGSSFEKIKLY